MASRPNIVFYFTDQQRPDTIGCYGQKLPVTPRLDAMAREGVRFERAFTPQPVCGPCRAIFQTGTLCHRYGLLPKRRHVAARRQNAGQLYRRGGL